MARERITRERVLHAATELADDRGLDGLTIRALAERLGAKPMAVYHHVADKSAILDGIVDAVFAGIERPVPGRPWRAELLRRSRSAHEVLGRHPWAVTLLESRSTPGADTLAHHDAVLGTLLSDGFGVVAAGHAYAMLDAYVYGFVVQESALPFAPEDAQATAAAMLGPFAEAYPHLARFAAERIGPDYRFGDEFDVGLELVLGAIATLREQAPRRDASP